jgi:hypothetical protein
VGLTTPHSVRKTVTTVLNEPQTRTDFLGKRHKEELSKYTLDLVRSDGTEMDWTFFYGEGNEDHELHTGFFVHERIMSAVKKLESVNEWMLDIIVK